MGKFDIYVDYFFVKLILNIHNNTPRGQLRDESKLIKKGKSTGLVEYHI